MFSPNHLCLLVAGARGRSIGALPMLGAPAVTVKLQLLPDLRIEIRRGDIKYKSVVNLDGIS